MRGLRLAVLVSLSAVLPRISLVDDEGRRSVEPGEFRVAVGGGQPVAAAPTTGIVEGRFVVTGRSVAVK